MTTAEYISEIRTRLILNQPWFGSLSAKLQVEESAEIPAMATDGTRLLINPEWLKDQSKQDLETTIAHEVSHCALLHPFRVRNRDVKQWNRATDYAVNQLLQDAGFTIPANWLIDPKYAGMEAEQIYSLLSQQLEEQQNQGKGQQPGEVLAAPADGQGDSKDGEAEGESKPEKLSATDWQVAAGQAAMIGRKAGHMPGGMDRALKASRDAGEDWRAILREFIVHTVPCDYSWSKPNRRYIGQGLYLPGVRKENAPKFTVAIDTSGSIGQTELQLMANELTAILHEVRPEAVDVIYCDTQINGIESFSPDDPGITLQAKGGGGTAFEPVFEHIGEQEEKPAALLYFTDLYGSFPDTEPEYPVLWVTTDKSTVAAPFGRTVHLSEWQ